MGQRLVALGSADKELTIVAAWDRADHPQLGTDVGLLAGVGPIGVPLSAGLPAGVKPEVVIDFSVPKAALAAVELCTGKRIPIVVATTGLDSDGKRRIEEAARLIPVLWAPSMSLAVNVTMKLTEVAGRALRERDADVEIIERHHRFKEDAPSGTALKFGEIVAGTMGHTEHRHGREGRPGKRPHQEIGYHAVRVGDNPGEHTIIFGLLGETIELTVRASNRDCYAVGAFAAAKFLAGKPVGLYSMKDVLGLD